MTALARKIEAPDAPAPRRAYTRGPIRIVHGDTLASIERRWGGLSLLQCAVLYVIGFHVDEDGVFRIPAHRIATLIGKGSDSRCAGIPHELMEFGLLEAVGGRLDTVRHWKLSRLGHAVFREISEE